jgi:hypothetical protein
MIKFDYVYDSGITLVVDDGQAVENYNRKQNVLFWTLMGVAAIALTFGIYTLIH